MATITTRSGKGSPLTHSEVDANFVNLNTDKLELSGGTMTGVLTLNGDPSASLHAATKQYVDTIAAAGLHYHTPVRVEAPSALSATYDNGTSGVGATLTNSGTLAAITIDGVALSLSDRVLVYNQATAAHNGVYTVTTVGDGSTAWVLTRATDADSYGASDPDALGQGDAFFVTEGATGAGELYVMNTEGAITFGTTDITFAQVAATAVYTAGSGISLDGTTIVNSAPDQTVTITGSGIVSVSGTYPNFEVAATALQTADIGVSVQAYDGNLTSFVSAFTLPTADGTAGQVLTTNGSGSLTLADAGGGGNSYDFTASGSITDGKPVIVNSDGTVSQVFGQTYTQALGGAVVYDSSATSFNSVIFDSNSNKVVVAYSDGASGGGPGRAFVGEVTGNSITFGSQVTFETGNTSGISMAFDSVSNKIIIAYTDVSNSSRGTVVIGEVSGTSITFGTPVVFSSNANSNSSTVVFDPTTDKIAIFYRSPSAGVGVVGTISGTSVTFGSVSSSYTSNAIGFSSGINPSTGEILVSYADVGDSWRRKVIAAQISGTSINYGSPVTYDSSTSGGSERDAIDFDANSGNFILAYYNKTSIRADARLVTVSGTTVSLGGTAVIQASTAPSAISVAVDTNLSKAFIFYRSSAQSGLGRYAIATISGGTISVTSPISISDTVDYSGATFDSNSSKIVFTYNDNNSSNVGTARTFQIGGTYTNLTSTNYIGMSDGSYSDAATATVQLNGSVNAAQSGLTTGLGYYVLLDGTLSTTPDSFNVYAGLAVSPTEIIIKG